MPYFLPVVGGAVAGAWYGSDLYEWSRGKADAAAKLIGSPVSAGGGNKSRANNSAAKAAESSWAISKWGIAGITAAALVAFYIFAKFRPFR